MHFFDERGETLVETLVSLLVVALSVLMLAQAIVSAARTNSAMSESDVVHHDSEQSVERKTSAVCSVDGYHDYVLEDIPVTVTETGEGANHYVSYSVSE